MAVSYRIPMSNADFDKFIHTSTKAMLAGTPATWIRLGLSTEQWAEWQMHFDQWQAVYQLYTDHSKRTQPVTHAKNKRRVLFIAFAAPLLAAISSNAATTLSDRATFGLRPANRSYSRRGNIEDIPFAHFKALGGGMMAVKVRRQTDEGRSSLHPLADIIELRYALCPQTGPFPTDLLQLPHVVLSTRTQFRLNLGSQHEGQILCARVRWANTRKADKSGPWTDLQRNMVG